MVLNLLQPKNPASCFANWSAAVLPPRPNAWLGFQMPALHMGPTTHDFVNECVVHVPRICEHCDNWNFPCNKKLFWVSDCITNSAKLWQWWKLNKKNWNVCWMTIVLSENEEWIDQCCQHEEWTNCHSCLTMPQGKGINSKMMPFFWFLCTSTSEWSLRLPRGWLLKNYNFCGNRCVAMPEHTNNNKLDITDTSTLKNNDCFTNSAHVWLSLTNVNRIKHQASFKLTAEVQSIDWFQTDWLSGTSVWKPQCSCASKIVIVNIPTTKNFSFWFHWTEVSVF